MMKSNQRACEKLEFYLPLEKIFTFIILDIHHSHNILYYYKLILNTIYAL